MSRTSSQPLDPSGVALGVAEIRRGGPAAGALETDDARFSITFSLAGLAPWRVRVDFLIYFDSWRTKDGQVRARRRGEYEYVPVGYELARPISVEHAEADSDAIARDFAGVSQKFTEQLPAYFLQAELLARHKRGDLEDVRRALMSGKAHRRLPLVAADYRAREESLSRIDDMSRAFSVSRWTINRALRACVAAGYLAADEIETRGADMTDDDRAVPKPAPTSPNPPNPSTPGIQRPGNKPDGRDDPRDGETR